MHAKYEVSISYGSKVMAKGKGFFCYRATVKKSRTGQKLDAHEFHSGNIPVKTNSNIDTKFQIILY